VTFVDLGMSPLANAYIEPDHEADPERFYPLHVLVCGQCFLVQLPEIASPHEIFSEYRYHSSVAESWIRHSREYVDASIERFGLTSTSRVVELGSNDGYLLQFFKARGIPVLGVEPAKSVAAVAKAKGIETDIAYFSTATAARLKYAGGPAALIVANNVMAQVPDLHGFVEGMKLLLAPEGTITVEFPHLLQLIAERQFDTIYHEHFSYFSLRVVEHLFAQHGLQVYDIAALPTHGGSLRIYARHQAGGPRSERVVATLSLEDMAGLNRIDTYQQFGNSVVALKCDILQFLISTRRAHKSVVAYGAPAKGNTLLNYLGIGPEFVEFTVDLNPRKQGCLLPGTRIPIRAPEAIFSARPNYILVLPWNLKDEIVSQLAGIGAWGGKFVVPIPTVSII
jgi:SAM-dependent methyltransferase